MSAVASQWSPRLGVIASVRWTLAPVPRLVAPRCRRRRRWRARYGGAVLEFGYDLHEAVVELREAAVPQAAA